MTRSPYQPATPVSVKICGIASPGDYDACKAAGAAFVGLVFFPRSPRHLSLPAASAIADHAEAGNGGPARVALTVDMDDATLDAVVAAARPHYIQLHGSETPDRAAAIRDRLGLPLIKAIRVASAADLDVCADWDGIADWLLFDAKGDPDGLPGGTGHSFDWSLLADHGNSAADIVGRQAAGQHPARAVAMIGQ